MGGTGDAGICDSRSYNILFCSEKVEKDVEEIGIEKIQLTFVTEKEKRIPLTLVRASHVEYCVLLGELLIKVGHFPIRRKNSIEGVPVKTVTSGEKERTDRDRRVRDGGKGWVKTSECVTMQENDDSLLRFLVLYALAHDI